MALCTGSMATFWWVTFVFLMLALTIRDCAELIGEMLEFPKQTEINMIFNESMSLPTYTICISKEQAWSHHPIKKQERDTRWDAIVEATLSAMTDRDSLLNSSWDYRLVVEATDFVATYNSMEREVPAPESLRAIDAFKDLEKNDTKKINCRKWLDIIISRNVTFDEMQNKAGLELLQPSLVKYNRTVPKGEVLMPTTLRTSWISEKQVCFQPYHDNPEDYILLEQGSFFKIRLEHNESAIEEEEIDCITIDFHGRPSSLMGSMEAKGRARDGFSDELCLGEKHQVIMEVRSINHMLESSNPKKTCREMEEDEDDEFDCRARCRMHMIRIKCNCTAISLAYLSDNDSLQLFPLCEDYTDFCDIHKVRGRVHFDSILLKNATVDEDFANATSFVDLFNYNRTIEEVECNRRCRPNCEQIRYDLVHKNKGKNEQTNQTDLVLIWGSFEYLTMDQSYKYTVSGFIAAFGGAVSLWLGLSVLSVVQGFQFMYDHCIKDKTIDDYKDWRKLTYPHIERSTNPVVRDANPIESPFKPSAPPAVHTNGRSKQ